MRVLRYVLLAAGTGVLTTLIVRIGPATIASMLASVGWSFLVVSGLYVIHVVVRAIALWRSMPDAPVPLRDVIGVRLAGEAIETLTFTGPFLAEPAKGFLLRRRGLDGPEAYGAVAVEYLLYTLASAWMAGAALLVLLARDLLPHALRGPVRGVIWGVAIFTIGCGAATVSGIGVLAPLARRLVRPFGRGLSERVAAAIEPIERVLVAFMHRRPIRMAEVIAIEGASHALLAAEIWVVLRALGYDVGAAVPLLFEGGVKFISIAFFFIPGQLGASEGVYALLGRTLGYPAAAGVTLVLVRRLRALIAAGAGLGVVSMLGRKKSSAG